MLDELWEKFEPLRTRLRMLDATLKTGLTVGNRSHSATFLRSLPFAQAKDIKRFVVPGDLPAFEHDGAERPRTRKTFRAPLLLVKEFMQREPRLVTAVSERDVVFTNAYFGASFSGARPETACLVAGILGSALASWYFLMTGSTFGLWMQRLTCGDVAAMPIPDLEEAIESNAGKCIVTLVRKLQREAPNDHEWEALDKAVFDLYMLDETDRTIVRDGLFRATWQWKQGRFESVAPADLKDLQGYANAFLSTMDAWLSASNRRRMRAEIYDMERDAPLRTIRFVLEDTPGPSVMKVVSPGGPLSRVLAQIGDRTGVRLTDALVGARELRVHARDEVSIIKPAARRHWLGVCGLEDADAVVKDSVYDSYTT